MPLVEELQILLEDFAPVVVADDSRPRRPGRNVIERLYGKIENYAASNQIPISAVFKHLRTNYTRLSLLKYFTAKNSVR